MIDTTKGIWLNADRDDNNDHVYTIVIDGESFDISRNAHDEIQTVYFDLIKQGENKEQERIIELLESDPEDIIASGGGLRAGYETAIALIKGEK